MKARGWKLTLSLEGNPTRMVLMFDTWDAADKAAQAAVMGNVNRATVERLLPNGWQVTLDLRKPPHIPPIPS